MNPEEPISNCWTSLLTGSDFFLRFRVFSISDFLQIFFVQIFGVCSDFLYCLDFCHSEFLLFQIFSRFLIRLRFYSPDFEATTQIFLSTQILASDFFVHSDFGFRFFQHFRFFCTTQIFLQIFYHSDFSSDFFYFPPHETFSTSRPVLTRHSHYEECFAKEVQQVL